MATETMKIEIGVPLYSASEADLYRRGYAWGEQARAMLPPSQQREIARLNPVKDPYVAGVHDGLEAKPSKVG